MNNFSDDERCELDPTKICDNCFRCLEPPAGQDYARIEISAVYTGEDYLVEDGTADYGCAEPAGRTQTAVHMHTLAGCRSKKRRI